MYDGRNTGVAMKDVWQPAATIYLEGNIRVSTAQAICVCRADLAGGVFSHVIASPNSDTDPGVLTSRQIEIFNASIDRHIAGHQEHVESEHRIHGLCDIHVIYVSAEASENTTLSGLG